jgi:hypothetical protein
MTVFRAEACVKVAVCVILFGKGVRVEGGPTLTLRRAADGLI